MNDYGVWTAIFMIGIVVIRHCSLSLCIINVDILGMRNSVELEILAVDLITSISRRVIGNDCKVIRVVLSEDRVEVVLNPEHCVVSKTGGDNAHREFCSHPL